MLGFIVPFSVPLLSKLREDLLSKVADVIEEVKNSFSWQVTTMCCVVSCGHICDHQETWMAFVDNNIFKLPKLQGSMDVEKSRTDCNENVSYMW